MTINYTTNLGLAEPVTGTESGTWGDDVNKGITDYLDIAIAGTQTISGTQTAVTLSITNGSSSANNIAQVGSGATGSAQYQIINCTGSPASTLTITAPASSKTYVVINATSTTQSVKVVGTGPTAGVTVLSGEKALIVWNGSDFVKVSNTSGAGVFSSITNTGLTSGRVVYSTTGGLETDSANLTFNGTTLTANTLNLTNALGTAYGGTGLTSFTANGVLYASGTGTLATGSALTFDGTNFATTGNITGKRLDAAFAGQALVFVTDTTGAVNQFAISAQTGNEAWLGTITNNPLAFRINGSEQMRLTSTGLGIGTSSPAGRLQASVGSSPNAANILIGYAGLSANYFDANQNIFRDGSFSELMRLTSTGLGIGTSSPGAKLNISSTGGASALWVTNTTATTGKTWKFNSFDDGNLYIGIPSVIDAMTVTPAGNLGIGTSSPSYKLDVVGEVRANNLFRTTDGTNIGLFGSSVFASGVVGIGSSNSVPLVFGTGATERMRLDSSGNLGLGVTPSAWGSGYKAFEFGNSSTQTGALFSNGVNDTWFVSNAYFNGTNWIYKATGTATGVEQAAGQHRFYTASSGTAGSAISFTQAMTLDASGNLLVGTTSGSQKLTVAGNAVFDAGGGNTYLQVASGSSNIQVGTDGSTQFIYGVGAFPLTFSTNGTERARIDSSGNLLVGTTSQLDGGSITNNYNGNNVKGLVLNDNTPANTHCYIAFDKNSGTQIGTITNNSNTGVLYNVTSDYRLKTVIGAVSGSGERLDALEPIEYEWKETGLRTRGFLAHKFQEVYAGSVTGTKDAVDEQGNPVYQAMQASSPEVIADLVAEIQFLRKRLAALEAK